MKHKKRFICLICAAVLLLTGAIVSVANQGGEHSHEYQVTSFYNGVVTIKCKGCGSEYTEVFAEHINQRVQNDPLDVVSDGVINAKDYAYLLANYNEFGPINGFDDEGPTDWEGPSVDV